MKATRRCSPSPFHYSLWGQRKRAGSVTHKKKKHKEEGDKPLFMGGEVVNPVGDHIWGDLTIVKDIKNDKWISKMFEEEEKRKNIRKT